MPDQPIRTVGAVKIPAFLYGTAWKEERTERLVTEAVAAGFRGIDTANQRRHYYEEGVGLALRNALASGQVSREGLFIQTKFTYAEGQDHRLPYDSAADFPAQVRQSFESSIAHLGVDQIDSYILHGPRVSRGLSDGDLEVWRTMEELNREGRARLIGISNVTAQQLAMLCESAAIAPSFVQNRCFARTGWDRRTREVCRANDVVYQGFSLLTANVNELHRPEVREIAARHDATIAQVAFRFANQIGMISLTGTTDPAHMREDLGSFDIELSVAEVETIERIAG